jgi:hypothetical protein
VARCSVAIGLLSGLAALAAYPERSDQLPSLTMPQKVCVVFNKTRLTGTLVDLRKTDLVFQLNLSAPRVRYTLDDVKEIRAFQDNEVYYYDAKTRKWDTLTARKKAAEALRTRNVYKDIPDPPPVLERFYAVADGSGPTEEKALETAEQEAVRQAILAVPDGITMLQKSKEIEESVLPGCEELIKARSRPLARETGDNHVTMRVAVALDRKALAERLSRAGIKLSENARGVASSLPAPEEIRRNPAPILRAVLTDFHRTLLIGGMPGDFDGRSLKVYLRLSVDPVAYDLAVENLLNVLEAIRRPREGKGEATQALTEVDGPVPRYRSDPTAPRAPRVKFYGAGEWDLWVMTRREEGWSRVTWEQWILDTDIEQTLADVTGRLGVEVCVFGPGGVVLATAVVPQEPPPRRPEVFWKWGPARYKTSTDNRQHLFLSPVGIQFQALQNQGVLDCKLVEEFSRDVYVGPQPAGQKITGVQTRLVLMKDESNPKKPTP